METISHFLHQGFLAVVPFVILLGILIFVHELGHFLVAIWNGVRVETFSLGFGKKILQYKKGDTTYCLSIIPLGGYVKMYGDDITAQVPEDQKKYAFTHKKISQRIAIVLAGPLMNFFFAILILFAVSMIGEEVRSPVLGDITTKAAAYELGFRSGDKIAAVNDEAIETWSDFQDALTSNINKEISIKLIREKTNEEVVVKSTPKMEPNPNILSPRDYIGAIEGLNFSSKLAVVAVENEKSPAFLAGIRTGDLITKLNGQEVKFERDLIGFFTNPPKEVNIEYKRDFEDPKTEKTFTATISEFKNLTDAGFSNPELYLGEVFRKTPAEKAGLLKGDKILAINEKPTTAWEDVLSSIRSFDGNGEIKIKYSRSGKEGEANIKPEVISQLTANGGEEKKYAIGIRPFINIGLPETMLMKTSNPFVALKQGIEKTGHMTVMMVMSFLKLAQNKISPKHIGSVISIGQAASETFQIGLAQFLQMMAVMSINLFIINLLPIPILDGGHLLFYSIEALRGAPLSMRKMEVAQQVGLILLMSLMVFALYNDISKLFGSW